MIDLPIIVEELDHWQALCDAAPDEGPCVYQECSDHYTHIIRSGPDGRRFVCQLPQANPERSEAYARLFAASRQAMPRLIAMARRPQVEQQQVEALRRLIGLFNNCQAIVIDDEDPTATMEMIGAVSELLRHLEPQPSGGHRT